MCADNPNIEQHNPEDGVGGLLSSIFGSERIAAQIVHHKVILPTDACYAANRRSWASAITRLLDERGIQLYSHQALATDHIRAGHSVVVSTPTASGKSLIYNLPVLERLLLDRDARALYLFPLKALAQDQLMALERLCASWPKEGRPEIAVYDGDTSDHFRRKIRQNPPQVLISNPEMLHLGILPYHQQWTAFLAGLSHVIVDEAHCYRGVFGSNMAQVFRRLNRIAARYGARPTYVLCTATIGNPGEHAANLIGSEQGHEPVIIDKSGAPQGKRHFIFINPQLSASSAAIDLLKQALARGLRSIVYCRSRRMTELISIWAGSEAGIYKNRISAYRAGFLPEERRTIESRMASGELLAVISTSALELGIDIGGLDVCILVGYPGSISQTLQRGGRVGRSGRESAVFLIAGEDALDQFFARHPEDFFSRKPELAVINADNEIILNRHLECAAVEAPLTLNEIWLRQSATRKALEVLARQGLLLQSASGQEWLAVRKNPHRYVDLRNGGQNLILEDESGKIIGSMESCRAWREAHPGAVYLHHGQSYLIEDLDQGRARISAKTAKVSWFTRARSQKNTDILEEYERRALGRFLVGRGRLRITEQITGYEKRSNSGQRLLTIVPLNAPPQVFETEGIWIVIPDNIRISLENMFIHFMAAIHALEHAAIGLLPLKIMADRNDFGGISIPLHPQLGLAAVFIYDGISGGAGLTRQAFAEIKDILQAVHEVLSCCDCEDGCPSCVHSPKCGSGNRPISRLAALSLLDELIKDGHEGSELCAQLCISPAPERFNPELGTREFDSNIHHVTTVNIEEKSLSRIEFSPETSSQESLAQCKGQDWTPVPPQASYLVFDVETRFSAAEVGGWHRASQMGVSVAVAYDSLQNSYLSFTQDELPKLFRLMRKTGLIVGFNSLRFDYAVLSPFWAEDSGAGEGDTMACSLAKLPSLDLLQRIKERVGYRISLDNLCQATFSEPKSANGLEALRWWKEKRIDKLTEYCRKDVELTRRLYLFGLENGFLLFRNKARQAVRLPVDFRIQN